MRLTGSSSEFEIVAFPLAPLRFLPRRRRSVKDAGPAEHRYCDAAASAARAVSHDEGTRSDWGNWWAPRGNRAAREPRCHVFCSPHTATVIKGDRSEDTIG